MPESAPTPEALAQARAVVLELADRPAATRDEFQRRLAAAPAAAVRRVLADHVLAPDAGDWEDEGEHRFDSLARTAFQFIGCGAEGERLALAALDRQRDRRRRQVAYLCVQDGDLELFNALVPTLPEDDRCLGLEELVERSLRSERDDSMAKHFAELAEGLPASLRAGFFRRVEVMRKENGVPAATLYARVLAARVLPPPARDAMLRAIEEEADEAGQALLEGLVRKLSGPAEKAVRMSLRRLRENVAKRPAEAIRGRAVLADVAGDGRTVLVAELERLGGREVAAFTIDVERGLVTTHFERRVEPGEFDEEVDRWTGRGLVFRPVSPGHASAIVSAAVEQRLVAGRKVSPGFRGAIEAVSRAAPAPLPVPAPVSAEALRERLPAILAAPPFDDWRLEPHELARAGLAAPDGAEDAWVAAAGAAIVAARGKRLSAMVRASARAAATAGDEARAGVLAAAAEGAGLELVAAHVARATFRGHRAGTPKRRVFLRSEFHGDPAVRQRLREALGVGEKATGADLARLDFAEIARVVVQLSLKETPSASWPSEAEISTAAIARARRAVDVLQAGRPLPRNRGHPDTTPPGAGFERLEPWQLMVLNQKLDEAFVVWVDTTCRNCSVNCLGALKEDRTEAYFAEEHPAE